MDGVLLPVLGPWPSRTKWTEWEKVYIKEVTSPGNLPILLQMQSRELCQPCWISLSCPKQFRYEAPWWKLGSTLSPSAQNQINAVADSAGLPFLPIVARVWSAAPKFCIILMLFLFIFMRFIFWDRSPMTLHKSFCESRLNVIKCHRSHNLNILYKQATKLTMLLCYSNNTFQSHWMPEGEKKKVFYF